MALAADGLAPRRQASPLPDLVPAAPQGRAGGVPALKDGCYLIQYTPTNAVSLALAYEGTLRVETTTGRMIASGDLYERLIDLATTPLTFVPSPDPKAGIPIFPIDRYRYYLRVTELLPTDRGFSLAFEALRFSAMAVRFLNGRGTKWLVEDAFTARMEAAPADSPPSDPPPDVPPPDDISPDDPAPPDGFPPPKNFPLPELVFVGELKNRGGETLGTLKMGYVSPHLRKATVEIDRVPLAEVPQDSGTTATWTTIFDKVGWDITVSISDSDVAEPSGESWNPGEADAAMQARREKTDLNAEWHYHLLAVRRIDIAHTPIDPADPDHERENGERGHMYDMGGNLPREGLMVASDWRAPDKDAWGLIRGKRLGATVAYFRTAVHELGHAMGLQHNDSDNGFMCPTDVVARSSRPPEIMFPTNMLWSFAADDAHRLRHWPDLVVRPGGAQAPSSDDAPVSSFASDRYRLEVAPSLPTVPLGAPVRIHLVLSNVTDKPQIAPPSLGLQSGFVRGRVIDASGTARTFSTLVVSENHPDPPHLGPGKSIEDWLTLFQGAEGALFPAAGDYHIVVEATWRGPIVEVDTFPSKLTDIIDIVVAGETRITVTPAADAAHAEAARKVLATPDTLRTLAFGGDHLKEAIAAIGAALETEILRPHFAHIEAKRLATRFFNRMPDLKAAADLIDETTVLSPAELRKLAPLVKSNAASPGAQALAKTLKARLATEAVSDEIGALVRDLSLDA